MIRFQPFVATALVLSIQPVYAQRATQNFNANWRLHVGDLTGAETPAFNDAAWKAVTLPHAWNEDSAFKVAIEKLPTGVAWYRKTFTLPAEAINKKVFVEFEGIRQGGEFYLNGKFIGRHENGIMAFGFDLSGKVKPGENVIAAKIDNAWDYREKATNGRFQWNDRNFYANYGGINKNVKLHISDRLYQTLPLFSNLGTTGVYVFAQNFDIPGKSAQITAQSQVKNEYDQARTFGYTVQIADRNGKIVATFNGPTTQIGAGETKVVAASSRVSGLEWWSWGYGALYDVTTTLTVNGAPVDSVQTRTGFRKTQFQNGVLKLNDRTLQIHGYAPRSTNEWPALGTNVPAWMSDYSNRLAVQSGGNLFRWMHVTPSKQDVESCDRVGLLQALPAGDSERDVTGRRWEQRVEVMRDAIIYNRNNPSVIFYEAGNNKVSEEHIAEMIKLRDQYDPQGGRAMGSRDMQDSKIAEWGGHMLYIEKSAGKPMWQTEYSRDEGLRAYWDNWSPPFHKDGDGPMYRDAPAPSYNRNQDSHAVENVKRWFEYWRERPGTGKRVNGGGVNIIWADSNTHKRGEAVYRASGEVDAVRLPKDNFFAHQVMWNGWVDVEKPSAHIISHWNYAPGTEKPVYVVSSAERVELFLNGKSLGFGQPSHRFLFTFPNVKWEAGTLRAVGYDAEGKTICQAQKITAGAPVSIRLTPITSPTGWKADGSDIALVDVEVVDAQNRRVPTALNPITFSHTGPAQWRGGIANGPDSYILAQTLPVENGVNRVMLRSMPQAGRVVLTASANGLKSATLELNSIPAPQNLIPGADLPSFTGRGPTPLGDSIVLTRTPLQIAKTSAGANAENAANTLDDNEHSSWSSDGQLSTGWIGYELEKPSLISEVTLKMGGWRERSYPVRVWVDNKPVFAGWTPTSLGYVTLPFAPTLGRTLKIQLTGNAQSGDAAKDIVELAEPGNAATVGKSNAKGTLSIVEAELYGPLPGQENRPKNPLLASTVALALNAPQVPDPAQANTPNTTANARIAPTNNAQTQVVEGAANEKVVAFRAGEGARFVFAAPNGGLNLRGKEVDARTTFVLIDQNGGDLVAGDKIQVRWAPTGAKPTHWQEADAGLARIGGKPNEKTVFTVHVRGAGRLVLQTASGKFVGAKGTDFSLVDKVEEGVELEVAAPSQ